MSIAIPLIFSDHGWSVILAKFQTKRRREESLQDTRELAGGGADAGRPDGDQQCVKGMALQH